MTCRAARTPPRSGRRTQERQRGKQEGTTGNALLWVAVPDEHVSHRPHGCCGSGADLADARDAGIERSRQVHDPPEVQITVWQHDVHRVRCDCGAEHVEQLPDAVSAAPSSYGVNLKSLTVYLLVYQHIPAQRCVQLIADVPRAAVVPTASGTSRTAVRSIT